MDGDTVSAAIVLQCSILLLVYLPKENNFGEPVIFFKTFPHVQFYAYALRFKASGLTTFLTEFWTLLGTDPVSSFNMRAVGGNFQHGLRHSTHNRCPRARYGPSIVSISNKHGEFTTYLLHLFFLLDVKFLLVGLIDGFLLQPLIGEHLVIEWVWGRLVVRLQEALYMLRQVQDHLLKTVGQCVS